MPTSVKPFRKAWCIRRKLGISNNFLPLITSFAHLSNSSSRVPRWNTQFLVFILYATQPDHNYKNNPPADSNWELLCLYFHDNKYSCSLDAKWLAKENLDKKDEPTTTHSPFANLKDLLRKPS